MSSLIRPEARDGIHNEDAPADALEKKRVAGATVESRDTMAHFATEQLIDILDGKRPPRPINPEVWPASCKRLTQLRSSAG